MHTAGLRQRLAPYRHFMRWLAIGLAAAIWVASQWGVYSTESQSQQAARWVNHTYGVIQQLIRIEAGLSGAEAALRGYALTGDEDALLPFEEGMADLEEGFVAAQRLTRDGAAQQKRLAALEPLLRHRIASLRAGMTAARSGLPATQIVTSERLHRTRAIRSAIDAASRHEHELLAARIARAESEERAARLFALLGMAIAVLLFALFFWDTWRQSQKMRDAEELLRLTVDNAPIGMVLLTPDGDWKRSNDTLGRILGYSREELLSMDVGELVGADDRAAFDTELRRLGQGELSSFQLALRLQHREGREILGDAAASLVRSADGAPYFIILEIQDLTERKRAQEQVRLVARVMRLIVESQDVDAALSASLKELCESLGWDYAELWFPAKGASVLASHPAWYARSPERLKAFREGTDEQACAQDLTLPGRVWKQARPEWHADLNEVGRETLGRDESARASGLRACVGIPLAGEGAVEGVLVLLRGMPLSEDERQLSVLMAVASQIGTLIQRKRAERALAISEERMQLASKATSDVIYDWNVDTDELWLGEALTRNFGHECHSAGNAWRMSLIHADDVVAVTVLLRDALAGDARHFMAEYRLRCADGSYAHVFDRAFIVRDQQVRALRLIGSIMDITSRVRSEEALRAAKEGAEAAARAKTHFLANMSHEIRTPLTALLGFADLMLEPKLPEADRLNYAMTIRRNGEHLLSLLNDILDVAKIEAGKVALEMMECSPADVLAEVTSLMRVRALEKGLSLELVYETPLPGIVRTDPTRLRQIVLNLVNNAVKFTQQGSVRVQTRFEAAGDVRGSLVIRVVDTGIGMTSEQVSRVFQPFSQADASMSRRFGGTGLGLAICAPIAAALGGSLSVETALNEGSTFTLALPVELVAGRAGSSRPSEALSDANLAMQPALPARVRSNAILLAEDGHDNQVLISTLLRKHGFAVTVAENGKVAVDAALRAAQSSEPFDVVLMDMQMPELDGYNATAMLRAKGYSRPIVALTAHAMSGERERCLRIGCDDYLSKPIDRVTLVDSVTKWSTRAAENDQQDTASSVTSQFAAPSSDPSSPARSHADPLFSEYQGDPEIRGLIDLFVADLPVQLRALASASAGGDRDLVARLAKELRDGAFGYGFPSMAVAAADLERAARGSAPSCDEEIACLRSICERTRPCVARASGA